MLAALVALVASAMAQPCDTGLYQGQVALSEDRTGDAIRLSSEAMAVSPTSFAANKLFVQAHRRAGGNAIALQYYRNLLSDPQITPDAQAIAEWILEAEPTITANDPLVAGQLAFERGETGNAMTIASSSDDWQGIQLHIKTLVELGKLKPALKVAKAGISRFPDRPSIILGLWSQSDLGRLNGKRDALFAKATSTSGDICTLYQARQLAIAASNRSLATALNHRLAAAGEPEPMLSRNRWTKRMWQEVGKGLSNHDIITLPPAAADELMHLGRSTSTALIAVGRGADAAQIWRQIDESTQTAESALNLGRSLRAVGDSEGAMRAWERAASLSTLPDNGNLFGLSLSDQAGISAQIALYQATASRESGAFDEAMFQAINAHLLMPEQASANLMDDLSYLYDEPVNPEAIADQGILPTNSLSDASVHWSLARSRAHAEKGEFAEAERSQKSAAITACNLAFESDTCSYLVAETHALRGLRLSKDEDHAGAADAYGDALLLHNHTGWMKERGDQLMNSGHKYASEFILEALDQTDASTLYRSARATQLGSHAQQVSMSGAVSFSGSVGDQVPSEEQHRLNLTGKVTIINFWASWCTPCKAELPALDKLMVDIQTTHPDTQLLAISTDERERDYKRFLFKHRFRTAQTSRDLVAASTFRISSIPCTLVIDGNGVVRSRFLGYDETTTVGEITAAIEQAVSQSGLEGK